MSFEFRSATRGLWRWRGSVVAAVTLAIGIGTTTGLAAFTRALLANLDGVPDLHRIGRVYAVSPALGVDRSQVALGEFDATLSKTTSFSAIGGYADEDALLGHGLDAAPAVAGYASPAFFTALGVPPQAGRVFTAGDLTGPPVAVLSHALWRRQFPDGRLDGATIVVDGVERAVVGVMPAAFRYPFVGISADVWVPLAHPSVKMPAIVQVYARLRDGVEWPAAQAELAALSLGQWRWHAIVLADDSRTRAVGAFAGTMGPALLVLLIACVNVACMLMARGVKREHELSVRRALGATRARIVSVLFAEHLVLAVASGVLGSALAVGLLRVLASGLAAVQPALASSLAADVRLLPVALGATALACVLFGTVPALSLSKGNVAATLNGLPVARRLQISGYGARDAVVFGQVACAVGFLVWTAMLYTLFAQLDSVKPGFPADHVVAMRVPADAAPDAAARVALVPGVSRASISSGLLGGGTRDRVEGAGTPSIVVSRVPVGDGFLDTLGLPLVSGRPFDASELRARARVAILTESGARQLGPGRDAVGMRLKLFSGSEVTVIGVCRDAFDHGLLSAVDGYAAEMYVPYEPPAGVPEAVVLARVPADPHATLRAIAAAAQTPSGMRPARPVVLSDDFQSRRRTGAREAARALGAFALLTVFLAASGVFAVISQSVAQRTRELAVRVAIGASPGRVLRMVLAREVKLIAAAIMTGVTFTMLATRALFAELTQLSAAAPSMWFGTLALSGGVAAVAVTLATWNIVRLAPADVLRRS